jgi:chromosome segregation ATPase
LEEEVKIIYSESQRLTREVQDLKAEGERVSEKLKELEEAASTQRLTELRNEIRELAEKNAILRDKTIAYYTKSERAIAEVAVKEHNQRKVTVGETLEKLNGELMELREKTLERVRELEKAKEGQKKKINEVRKVIEEQKRKIGEWLEKKDQEEEGGMEE